MWAASRHHKSSTQFTFASPKVLSTLLPARYASLQPASYFLHPLAWLYFVCSLNMELLFYLCLSCLLHIHNASSSLSSSFFFFSSFYFFFCSSSSSITASITLFAWICVIISHNICVLCCQSYFFLCL